MNAGDSELRHCWINGKEYDLPEDLVWDLAERETAYRTFAFKHAHTALDQAPPRGFMFIAVTLDDGTPTSYAP